MIVDVSLIKSIRMVGIEREKENIIEAIEVKKKMGA